MHLDLWFTLVRGWRPSGAPRVGRTLYEPAQADQTSFAPGRSAAVEVVFARGSDDVASSTLRCNQNPFRLRAFRECVRFGSSEQDALPDVVEHNPLRVWASSRLPAGGKHALFAANFGMRIREFQKQLPRSSLPTHAVMQYFCRGLAGAPPAVPAWLLRTTRPRDCNLADVKRGRRGGREQL